MHTETPTENTAAPTRPHAEFAPTPTAERTKHPPASPCPDPGRHLNRLFPHLTSPEYDTARLCDIHELTVAQLADAAASEAIETAINNARRLAEARLELIRIEAEVAAWARLTELAADHPNTATEREISRKAAAQILRLLNPVGRASSPSSPSEQEQPPTTSPQRQRGDSSTSPERERRGTATSPERQRRSVPVGRASSPSCYQPTPTAPTDLLNRAGAIPTGVTVPAFGPKGEGGDLVGPGVSPSLTLGAG